MPAMMLRAIARVSVVLSCRIVLVWLGVRVTIPVSTGLHVDLILEFAVTLALM